jgi:hypothetical protein
MQRGTNGQFQPKPNPIDQERQQFETERQDHHWNTQIGPSLDNHASQTFQKLFAPYAGRLKLDANTTNALKMEFSRRVASTAAKDKTYMAQIGRYRAQKNPDPATVTNFAKVQFDKHAQTVLKGLVDERYKPFLNGKPKMAPSTTPNGAKAGPVAPGVKIVAVKPPMDKINHKATPIEWIREKKYRMYDGSIVQVRQ